MSQSWVPISTILKTAPKILESPKYAKNVAMVQVDKFLRHSIPSCLNKGRPIESDSAAFGSQMSVISDATHAVNGATRAFYAHAP